jgi:hypothetical protein
MQIIGCRPILGIQLDLFYYHYILSKYGIILQIFNIIDKLTNGGAE